MRIFLFLFIPLTILMLFFPDSNGKSVSKSLPNSPNQYHIIQSQTFGTPFPAFRLETEAIAQTQYASPRQFTIISSHSTLHKGIFLNPLCAALISYLIAYSQKKRESNFHPFTRHWANGVLILAAYGLLDFLITSGLRIVQAYSYWIQSRERMNSIPGVLLFSLVILYFPTLLGYLYSKSSLKFSFQQNDPTRPKQSVNQAPATTLTPINQPSSILPKKAQIEAKPPISE